MKRADLEHVIRAAGSIANCHELVIIGSQAILGSFPDAPQELTVSQEVDTFPMNAPHVADLIDGSIGEKSPFHETFGYYAHGVAPETAVLPANWKSRLVRVENENTNGIAGLCLHPLDLAISKLAAGREKDIAFVTVMLNSGMISNKDFRAILLELGESQASVVRNRFEKCCRASLRKADLSN